MPPRWSWRGLEGVYLTWEDQTTLLYRDRHGRKYYSKTSIVGLSNPQYLDMRMERRPHQMRSQDKDNRCGVNYRPTWPLVSKHNGRAGVRERAVVRGGLYTNTLMGETVPQICSSQLWGTDVWNPWGFRLLHQEGKRGLFDQFHHEGLI